MGKASGGEGKAVIAGCLNDFGPVLAVFKARN
jgi:hypothetical protein